MTIPARIRAYSAEKRREPFLREEKPKKQMAKHLNLRHIQLPVPKKKYMEIKEEKHPVFTQDRRIEPQLRSRRECQCHIIQVRHAIRWTSGEWNRQRRISYRGWRSSCSGQLSKAVCGGRRGESHHLSAPERNLDLAWIWRCIEPQAKLVLLHRAQDRILREFIAPGIIPGRFVSFTICDRAVSIERSGQRRLPQIEIDLQWFLAAMFFLPRNHAHSISSRTLEPPFTGKTWGNAGWVFEARV
jgi:hypothetical protein